MVSVTIIDLTRLIKNVDYCVKYNNFIRKHFIRICFPFSISIVFLFWMLILLGDEFQYNSRSLWDFLVNFCFHGLQFVFLLHDTLAYPHQMEINKIFDLIIISIMTAVYFVILGFGKYKFDYQPYDFMEMSNVRQIAGAAILIYIGVLDGYVVFVLIAGKCFVDKNINMENIKNEIMKEKNNLEKKEKEKKNNNNSNNKEENVVGNNLNKEGNKNVEVKINKNAINYMDNTDNMNTIIIPKGKRKKLKPLQLNKNINDNELKENKKE